MKVYLLNFTIKIKNTVYQVKYDMVCMFFFFYSYYIRNEVETELKVTGRQLELKRKQHHVELEGFNAKCWMTAEMCWRSWNKMVKAERSKSLAEQTKSWNQQDAKIKHKKAQYELKAK